MTRRHIAMLISWLATGPGLLFAVPALAIPADPGQPAVEIVTTVDPLQQLPVNSQAEAVAVESGDDVSPETAAGISVRSLSDPLPAPDGQSGPAAGIPCLYGEITEHLTDQDMAAPECANELQQTLSMSVGQRQAVGSGVLGETDGVRVDYRLNSGMKLHGVAGYPSSGAAVESFNSSRRMYGLSADSGTLAQHWNLNAWFLSEQNNAPVDTGTIGGTLRYLRPHRALLVFMDYDTELDRLAAVTASGAWKLGASTTLGAIYDVRNRAPHKSHKKHLQYSMAATDGWNWILPDQRIKHYTGTRDRQVTTRGLSLSHAFSQRLKLNGDFAMLDVQDMRASATGASAVLPSEYFYHLKFTGKDLLISGISNKLDLRHQVTGSSRIYSASLDSRYPINRLWHLTPRLQTEHRNSISGRQNEWITSPAVKMEYRWKQSHGFQIEAGGKWSHHADAAEHSSRLSYSLSLGYQANF